MTKTSTLAQVLKKLDKLWKNTEAAEITSNVTIPDGDYVAVLKDARVELSKASSRLQIAWPIKIVEGKQKGKSLTKFDGLDTELSISWSKALMETLGIAIPKKASDIPKILAAFFEDYDKTNTVNVTVKTVDDFTNIYINGYTEKDDDDNANDTDDDDNDDDSGDDSDDDDDDDDDDANKVPSEKEIGKMKKKQLKAVILDFGLDMDLDDYDNIADLKEAIIEELEDLD